MEEKTTALRVRMIEDMRIRGMGDKAQKAHIRAIKDFAWFLGRSPDTATADDLRAYQLHMTEAGIKHMQFRRQPRKLPVVLSVEDVSDLLEAAPGPGLKYRAALSISYGAGLRASEVCGLKLGDIDSDRMLIHVEQSLPRTSIRGQRA
jgi:integrase